MSQVTEKMRPDEGVLNATSFESKALKKVQLDVEDAPFLEEEKEEVPATLEETDGKAEENSGTQNKKKKLIIIIGISAVVLLLLLGAAGYFFFFSGPPPEEPLIVVIENYTDPTIPPTYETNLLPFWIEMKDSQGNTFFLVCTFVLSAKDSALSTEINQKITQIRDVVYYYLSTKSYDFLTNHSNISLIKDNLLENINQFLIQGKLEDLYYENYMVR